MAPDSGKMANAVAIASQQLRDGADSIEKWDDPEFDAWHRREYAVAVESNIPDNKEVGGLRSDKNSDRWAQSSEYMHIYNIENEYRR